MTDLVKQLRIERDAIKARVTSFRTFLNTVPEDTTAPEIISEISRRYEAIERNLDLFYGKHLEVLLALGDDALIEAEDSKKVEFENLYFSTVALASYWLESVNYRPNSNNSNNTSLSANGNVSNTQAQLAHSTNIGNRASSAGLGSNSSAIASNMQIRLPKISLPSFSGTHETWLEFRDKFTSLIHSNASLTDIQKLHYLKSCVTGEAANVICGLSYTANSYSDAWDILNNRYNNTRVLIHHHIRSIFEIEKMNKESSVKLRSMLDNFSANLAALELLKPQATNLFDVLIVFLITSKLDSITARDWEEKEASLPHAIATLDDLKKFLVDKINLLSGIDLKRTVDKSHVSNSSYSYKQQTSKQVNRVNVHVANASTSNNYYVAKCPICKRNHPLRECDEFLKLSVSERYNKIKELNRCINCLCYGHLIAECNARRCRICYKKHNTLLHFNDTNRKTNVESNIAPIVEDCNLASTSTNSHSCINSSNILLSTAVVYIFDKFRKVHKARVLLDSASQSNFVTQSLADKLQLSKLPIDMTVNGIMQVSSSLSTYCSAEIKSAFSNFSLRVDLLVAPTITSLVPGYHINRSMIQLPSNIQLADPDFNIPSPVDILLGAEYFWSIMDVGQICLPSRGPIIQKTKLGWILGGKFSSSTVKHNRTSICNLVQSESSLDWRLKQFWEVEELSRDRIMSSNDIAMEQHFSNTFRRNPDGRFVVTILLDGIDELGDTQDIAYKRYINLERKLKRSPEMKSLYDQFMLEYLSLGHMAPSQSTTNRVYYLPHHCVINNNSSSTRLRVVFDGSALPITGKALNQCQFAGPTIQDDLLSILLRFRLYTFVASADIEKMYRQVLIDDSQTSLQRIFWRPTEGTPISSFDLKTVTYGTTSAAYLAIRCLREIANDDSLSPDVVEAIVHDFYVDDLLTGADTMEKLRSLISGINNALAKAQFPLRKWTSNCKMTLDTSSGNHYSSQEVPSFIELCSKESSKVLGLIWSSSLDSLHYRISSSTLATVTKRSVLSIISQIFDPLGLLSPVTLVAKAFMQKLWRIPLGWDDRLDSELCNEWLKFQESLNALNSLSISRHVCLPEHVSIELHGFCDASENGYGACVYIKSEDRNGLIKISLLCAKTKVAPIKTLTIPRLELCGALLLSQLVSKVNESLNLSFCSQYFWCDSTIVLAWINTCPSKLQTFVAHRISKIQTLTNVQNWRYVPTDSNPADLASRGTTPSYLLECELWWSGANWLKLPSSDWPENIVAQQTQLEFRKNVITALAHNNHLNNLNQIIEITRFSTLGKLERTLCYILRFIQNCRNKIKINTDFITIGERKFAHQLLIKSQQELAFDKEISALKHNKPIQHSSKLLALSPFLDNNNLLRVGGRLRNAQILYDAKHQILLPSKNHLTRLIFQDTHIRELHIGPLGLLNAMRQRYWPIQGRREASSITHECIVCFKANPKPSFPIMGNLPSERVTPAPVFDQTGIDYAGPFTLKTMNGRGCKHYKGYVAIFVCLTVKAVHLELVTSLTTDSYIAALRRFISRRGKPCCLHSDNATNFVGADRELRELMQFLRANETAIGAKTSEDGINWKFIPARSPHFGGLWESGVKSVKFHLRRVLNDTALTFEDFYTLLVQIEAILNSRPLTPLSSNPNDLSCLTPAHLLIGRPLLHLVDNEHTTKTISNLSRFKLIQQMVHSFWSRWSKEYLHHLQQRSKWKQGSQNKPIGIGMLVLLIEDNVPPRSWKFGRITQLHPGADNIVRVVSLRTVGGSIIKRAVQRICPLPKFEDDQRTSDDIQLS